MENANVSITLTVAQWQSLLNAMSHAPYAAVTSINETVNSLQAQAAEQIQALQKEQEDQDTAA
jgi:hypothetical protein